MISGYYLISLVFLLSRCWEMLGFFWKYLKWRAQKRHSFEDLVGTVIIEKIQCPQWVLFNHFKTDIHE
jgi:hypothetical protein